MQAAAEMPTQGDSKEITEDQEAGIQPINR